MRDKLNDPARLSLMVEAINNIDSFLDGVTSEEDFISDKILCHAVLYNFQCIGEGVYRLSDDFRSANPSIDWAAIAGLRHVLVHDYYNVDLSQVWGILITDLPELRKFLKQNG